MAADSLMDASVEVWQRTLDLYDQVLRKRAEEKKGAKAEAKAKELLDLDKWFQSELPVVIENRTEKHLTKDELIKLMQWKLLRGKFRPRLVELIKENTPETITENTTLAFKLLPDVEKAIKKLTELTGVGPATASAVLCAGSPQVPFMADEAMMALPVGKGKLEYSPKAYRQYLEQIRSNCLTKLQKTDPKGGWNEHKVELALWTFVTASKHCPDLLQKPSKHKHEEEIDSAEEKASKKMKKL